MEIGSPLWPPIVCALNTPAAQHFTHTLLVLIRSQQIFVYLKKPKEETAMPTFEVLTEYKIHAHISLSKPTLNITPWQMLLKFYILKL